MLNTRRTLPKFRGLVARLRALKKKFEADQTKMDRIVTAAEGESALGILRKLRELDDGRK